MVSSLDSQYIQLLEAEIDAWFSFLNNRVAPFLITATCGAIYAKQPFVILIFFIVCAYWTYASNNFPRLIDELRSIIRKKFTGKEIAKTRHNRIMQEYFSLGQLWRRGKMFLASWFGCIAVFVYLVRVP